MEEGGWAAPPADSEAELVGQSCNIARMPAAAWTQDPDSPVILTDLPSNTVFADMCRKSALLGETMFESSL